jgi:hypothetical protein
MIEGNGADSGAWRTEGLTLKPGGLYRLSFRARKDLGTTGGCLISGPSRVNRDFQPGETWERFGFVFAVPDDAGSDPIRLGQWQVKGSIHFDDVELLPVRVVHEISDPVAFVLGEGEGIERGVYRFQPNYGGPAANYHRALRRNRAAFNSDRWVFSPGAEVIYGFDVLEVRQTSGRVRLNVNYYHAGSLRVEASRDATNWVAVTTLDGQRRGGWSELPASLFPARQVFLRLSMPVGEGSLQVNACDYEAGLETSQWTRIGNTHYLEVLRESPDLSVGIFTLATTPPLTRAGAVEREYSQRLQHAKDAQGLRRTRLDPAPVESNHVKSAAG